jgi:hypothetical protein
VVTFGCARCLVGASPHTARLQRQECVAQKLEGDVRVTLKKLVAKEQACAEVSMRAATRLVTLIAIILLLPGMLKARAAEEVDLLLVLSSDVSRSIDTPKI